MKLKTSVAAVILAFSATGAWAGPTGTDQSKSDMGTPDATAVQPSGGAVDEQLEWKFVNGQTAGSESQSGQSAATENQAGSDQSAKTEDEGEGNDQAAAANDEDSNDQAAASEEESADQTANSEEQSSEGQSVRSEEQDESDQSASSDNPAADLTDKVVVIIPKDWKGSLPDLITALEASPDARDIVIVQQGDPQAGNNEPDDSYSAGNKPVINQQ